MFLEPAQEPEPTEDAGPSGDSDDSTAEASDDEGLSPPRTITGGLGVPALLEAAVLFLRRRKSAAS